MFSSLARYLLRLWYNPYARVGLFIYLFALLSIEARVLFVQSKLAVLQREQSRVKDSFERVLAAIERQGGQVNELVGLYGIVARQEIVDPPPPPRPRPKAAEQISAASHAESPATPGCENIPEIDYGTERQPLSGAVLKRNHDWCGEHRAAFADAIPKLYAQDGTIRLTVSWPGTLDDGTRVTCYCLGNRAAIEGELARDSVERSRLMQEIQDEQGQLRRTLALCRRNTLSGTNAELCDACSQETLPKEYQVRNLVRTGTDKDHYAWEIYLQPASLQARCACVEKTQGELEAEKVQLSDDRRRVAETLAKRQHFLQRCLTDRGVAAVEIELVVSRQGKRQTLDVNRYEVAACVRSQIADHFDVSGVGEVRVSKRIVASSTTDAVEKLDMSGIPRTE